MAALVSVVIPVLNEALLGKLLDALRAEMAAARLQSEIIIVDDSHSQPPAAFAGTRWIAGPNRGKGRAVREGLLAATGDVVFVIDADLNVLLPHLRGFVDLVLREGYDVVIAARTPDWHARGLFRFFLSYGLYLLQRYFVLSSRRFVDTQCGFKAFRRSAAADMAAKQRVEGGMYDIEYLYIAELAGLRIAQVPVGVIAESRPSRLRIGKCLRQDPVDLLRIKWRGLTGGYGPKVR